MRAVTWHCCNLVLTSATSKLNFSLDIKIKSSGPDGGISSHLLINCLQIFSILFTIHGLSMSATVKSQESLACKYRKYNNILFLGCNGRLPVFIKITFVSYMMFALCSALSILKLYQWLRYLKLLSISTIGTWFLTRNNFGLNWTDLVTVFLIPKVLHSST